MVRETEREQDRHYESETAISFPTIPSVHEPLHMVIRAGPNYSNIRILVRKISIRSLNQYSEFRFFFSTYVTLPERGNQTISVSDTKQRSERGGGRIDILFPFTLYHNISGISGGKVILDEMLTLVVVYVRCTAPRQSTVPGLLQSVSVLGVPGQYN